MNVITLIDSFDQEVPQEWQKIYVWDGECWLDGYYYFSDHHTYPHEIYSKVGDFGTAIEGYTGEAEWMPYRD